MQRGRADWLCRGDQNTNFFHRAATGRRKKFFIKKLKGESGDWIEEDNQLKGHVAHYFEGLFSSDVQEPDQAVLDNVNPRVSDAMNEFLAKDFTAEEVKTALFQMAPSKAPGVDGFTAGFFQRHWDVLGDDITAAILDFLNGGELPSGMNDKAITLIPKVHNPQRIFQY